MGTWGEAVKIYSPCKSGGISKEKETHMGLTVISNKLNYIDDAEVRLHGTWKEQWIRVKMLIILSCISGSISG